MASFGIHGAVDFFSQLPPAARLDLDTTYIVRQPTGATSGAGLYWVVKDGASRKWVYLDDADFSEGGSFALPPGSEDDWEGSPPSTASAAIARLAAAFKVHMGIKVP